MTNKHKNYIFIRRRKKIEKRILRQGYLSLSLFPFFFHSLTRPILFNVKTDITTNKQKNYLFPSRCGNGHSEDEKKKMNTNDKQVQVPQQSAFTKIGLSPHIYGILQQTQAFTIREQVKLMPEYCFGCPPCLTQVRRGKHTTQHSQY